MRRYKKLLLSLLAITACAPVVSAVAGEGMYAVTITNITRGQTLTPILVATHLKGHPLFELGDPASVELATVAESGNTAPLADMLMSSGKAYDTASSGGLLGPGETVTVNVKMMDHFNYVSVVAMLIPTNDAFFAVNGMMGPKGKKMVKVMSPAFDAGSEMNDELCGNIPGPACGGEGASPDVDGEGYVHIHAGIHGIGDLTAAEYDWRNPVAKITMKRIKK